MRNLVVVSDPKHWNFQISGVEIIQARAYLTDTKYSDIPNTKVFNLCKSYRYQTTGYYVSLLAEARQHRPIPSVTTIQDFKSQTIIRTISDEIDELIQISLSRLKSSNFILSIYFGQNFAKQYESLSKKLYNLFQAPLLRAHFIYQKRWILQNISPIPLYEIPESHRPYIVEFAKSYFARKRFPRRIYETVDDLAILVNSEEPSPPSNKKAIEKFIEAAEQYHLRTELITKDDFSRVPEFDALFIRETTAVNHHTYRFSRRAATEGLVVIDDPMSILISTNKVYMTEILTKARIPIPKTLIVHKDNRDLVEKELGLPCVLKQPDSSFSQGVVKVTDRQSLRSALDVLFNTSSLIIAQEFTPTEFDWRIGVLDRKPFYASKYYMVPGHWQICNWKDKQMVRSGGSETLTLQRVPEQVVQMAVKAANLVGDGLYGVDLKQINNKVYVIEVNDNPSLEHGVEDFVLKDRLYLTVIKSFVNRLKKKKYE